MCESIAIIRERAVKLFDTIKLAIFYLYYYDLVEERSIITFSFSPTADHKKKSSHAYTYTHDKNLTEVTNQTTSTNNNNPTP